LELITTGLIIARRAKIRIPAKVGRRMLAALGLIPHEGLEYGMVLKGTWKPDEVTVDVTEDFFVPAQLVTPAHIEFTEQMPGPEWNVVIHRHPHGVNSFSGTDRNSINEEFLASMIFMPPWGFPDAIVNIPLADGVKVQIPAFVEVVGPMFLEEAEIREVIKAKVRRAASATSRDPLTVAGTPNMAPGKAGPLAPAEKAAKKAVSAESVGVAVSIGGGSVTKLGEEPAPQKARGLRRLPGGKQGPLGLGPLADRAADRAFAALPRWPGAGRTGPGGLDPEDAYDVAEVFQEESGRGSNLVNGGPVGYRELSSYHEAVHRTRGD
jgi:hypothetical protein